MNLTCDISARQSGLFDTFLLTSFTFTSRSMGLVSFTIVSSIEVTVVVERIEI